MQYKTLEQINPEGLEDLVRHSPGFSVSQLTDIRNLNIELESDFDQRCCVKLEFSLTSQPTMQVILTFNCCRAVSVPTFGYLNAERLAFEPLADRQWDRLHYRVITLDEDLDEIDDRGLSLLCDGVSISVKTGHST